MAQSKDTVAGKVAHLKLRAPMALQLSVSVLDRLDLAQVSLHRSVYTPSIPPYFRIWLLQSSLIQSTRELVLFLTLHVLNKRGCCRI